jgi:hypothetical protein
MRYAMRMRLIIGVLLLGIFTGSAKGSNLSALLTDAKDVRPVAAEKMKEGPQAWVVVFMGTQCRQVRNYWPNLQKWAGEWKAQGVELVGVFSHQHETLAEVAAFTKDKAPTFKIIHDGTQEIARAFGAEMTPEAFILGCDSRVHYRGRIDDQHNLLNSLPAPRHDYVLDGVKAILSGDFPKPSVTDVEGCYINLSKPLHQPTFTQDIGPLVYSKCTSCHRDKEVGGELFKFVSFDSIAPHIDTIVGVTESRTMPPWRAGTSGSFENNFSLDANDIWKLRRWAKNGTEMGPGKLGSPPAADTKGFRRGTPDAIVYITPDDAPADKKFFRVPPKSEEAVLPYEYFRVKTNFGEDKWLVASEIKAFVPEVVHHVTAFMVRPEVDDELILSDPRSFMIAAMIAARRYGMSRENFEWGYRLYGINMRRPLQLIANFSPTEPTRKFPGGSGFLIPKGAELVFEAHYTPTEKERWDRSAVGLWFGKLPNHPEEQQVITRSGGTMGGIKIPPNSIFTYDNKMRFYADAKLFSLRPHMHTRGKDFKGILEYPDGRKVTLLHIPDYDYNWQMPFDFAKPVAIPSGSVLHSIYTWDNTKSHPGNPDPNVDVKFGQQYKDEMCLSYPTYVYDKPAEREQAERKLEQELIENP